MACIEHLKIRSRSVLENVDHLSILEKLIARFRATRRLLALIFREIWQMLNLFKGWFGENSQTTNNIVFWQYNEANELDSAYLATN